MRWTTLVGRAVRTIDERGFDRHVVESELYRLCAEVNEAGLGNGISSSIMMTLGADGENVRRANRRTEFLGL